MELLLDNSWRKVLSDQFEQPYFFTLTKFLEEEYQTQTIFPPQNEIFTALNLTPYDQVKVVILGQDPYHGGGQAQGLAFSVKNGVKIPPSLRNIYKEMETDVDIKPASHGNLMSWAHQGVLLLNTVLTVREGVAYSHRGQGWEQFTDEIIRKLNQREQPIVFILWGKPAQEKSKMIDLQRHAIISAPHPSPLSARRGFFGSQPFSKTNQILKNWGEQPIDWELSETDE